jgi:hypothetical protein
MSPAMETWSFSLPTSSGGLGIEDGQGFHAAMNCELNQSVRRRVPNRHPKDKPPQREHRLRGVTKQCACRRPEPVSPTGNPVKQDAPEENAATLRPTTDAANSIRFKGSKREILVGRNPTLFESHHRALNFLTERRVYFPKAVALCFSL